MGPDAPLELCESTVLVKGLDAPNYENIRKHARFIARVQCMLRLEYPWDRLIQFVENSAWHTPDQRELAKMSVKVFWEECDLGMIEPDNLNCVNRPK